MSSLRSFNATKQTLKPTGKILYKDTPWSCYEHSLEEEPTTFTPPRRIPASELPFSAFDLIQGTESSTENSTANAGADAVDTQRIERINLRPLEAAANRDNTREHEHRHEPPKEHPDTYEKTNVEKVQIIDNPRLSTQENTNDTDHNVEKTYNDAEYLESLRLKAISLNAYELTLREAEILIVNDLIGSPGKTTVKKNLKYRCKFCEFMKEDVRTFQYPYQLLQHYRCHLNDRRFICTKCHRSFNRFATLLAHIRKKH